MKQPIKYYAGDEYNIHAKIFLNVRYGGAIIKYKMIRCIKNVEGIQTQLQLT